MALEPFSIRADTKTMEALGRIAAAMDRSRNWVINAALKAYVEDQEPGRLSPYHRAALYALRELTGRDTEPTAAAWRTLLKLPRKDS